jgi:hypothetical protein
MPSRFRTLRTGLAAAALLICCAGAFAPAAAGEPDCRAATQQFFATNRSLAEAMNRQARCQSAGNRRDRCIDEAVVVERARVDHEEAEERYVLRCEGAGTKQPRRISDLRALAGFEACLERRKLRLQPVLDRGLSAEFEVTSPRIPRSTTFGFVMWDLPTLLEHEHRGAMYSIPIFRNARVMQAMSYPSIRYDNSGPRYPEAPSRTVIADVIWAFRDCYGSDRR